MKRHVTGIGFHLRINYLGGGHHAALFIRKVKTAYSTSYNFPVKADRPILAIHSVPLKFA